jgi:hypothetical protein
LPGLLKGEKKNSLKKTARIAGFWHLLMAITGSIGLLYVPAKLIVPGDAAATANNIMASESLFRIGIVSNLLCQLAFIFLGFSRTSRERPYI